MKRIVVVACLLATLVPTLVRADSASSASEAAPDYKQLYEEQRKRNDELERRIGILEEKDKSEPYIKNEDVPESTLGFLKSTEISGFVSSSFFHNFNNPEDSINTGRPYDYLSDQFMLNKAVLTLQKSVEYNAFDWQGGYAVQTIFGQDAEYTQASGLDLGTDGDLFLANATLNIPVGNGVKVTMGKYGTLLGYELTLTEQNPNWSGGNQFTFVEPFTHTGLIFGYKPTAETEVQLLVFNGWDVVTDNNNAKSYMGYVNYAPNDNSSYTLIGYGGPEQDDNSSNWRAGVEGVATYKFTPQLSSAVQIDYGREDDAAVAGVDAAGDPIISGDAQWWAAGLWFIYDFTEKVQAALRTDYLNDIDGARTSDTPSRDPFPVNRGQELYSVTFTLNLKPIEQIRVAPEVRWDHSTLDTAFDGHEDQVTIGVGAAYFY